MQMALDEALFESTKVPSLRFYKWARPSLSFGYFGLFADVAPQMNERDIVRRWTGGGIVPHGDDLTYSVIFPRNGNEAQLQSREVYRQIHDAIRRALAPFVKAQLATKNSPAIQASCFANPVDGGCSRSRKENCRGGASTDAGRSASPGQHPGRDPAADLFARVCRGPLPGIRAARFTEESYRARQNPDAAKNTAPRPGCDNVSYRL